MSEHIVRERVREVAGSHRTVRAVGAMLISAVLAMLAWLTSPGKDAPTITGVVCTGPGSLTITITLSDGTTYTAACT